MRGLVQVHKVHVDAVPRQRALNWVWNCSNGLLSMVRPLITFWPGRKCAATPPARRNDRLIRVAANSGDFIRRGAQRFQTSLQGNFASVFSALTTCSACASPGAESPGRKDAGCQLQTNFIIIKNRHCRVLIESERPGSLCRGGSWKIVLFGAHRPLL